MAIQYVDRNGDACGSIAGPYTISASNNRLDFTIDGGALQSFTLTSGTRTAAQIVGELSTLTGATASVVTVQGLSYVRIRTTSALGAASTILIGAPTNNANATLGFIAASHTGGQNISASFTTNNKADIRSNIETQLVNAGWIVVSGSGSTNLLLQSAMTPANQNCQMRLRVRDNGNTCLVLSIEDTNGTRVHTNGVNNGAQLNPGTGRSWRIIANKYQAFIFEPTVNGARGYVGFGVLWIPTWLEGVIFENIWMNSNAANDTDATARGSFRSVLGTRDANGTGNQQIIINNSQWENANSTGNDNIGIQNLLTLWQGHRIQRNAATWYRWHDDAALLVDPLLAFGQLLSTDEGKISGQLWDAFISTDNYPIDTTLTAIDGHNWWNITNNQAGTTDIARGSLFVATT